MNITPGLINYHRHLLQKAGISPRKPEAVELLKEHDWSEENAEAILAAMTAPSKTLADGSINPDSWQDLFHTWDEFEKSEPIKIAIKGWLQEDGITMYGGLPGHGKSLLGMSTAKALLTGEPLFGQSYFSVNRAKKVLYFCPEVGLGPLKHRVKLFRLERFVQSGELLLRSLSVKEPAAITDPRILRACEGADVFL